MWEMKCPYCHKHLPYPTQRQFLVFIYRYIYKFSEIETAQMMGIHPSNVRALLLRMKKVWPQVFSTPRKSKPKYTQKGFCETKHTHIKIRF